jgi:hypothetical protein
MKKLLKILLVVLVVLFLLLQFYPRGAKNSSNISAAHINTVHTLPAEVGVVLKNACYDCHSNYTVYPWYASIQPVALWLGDHIDEGRKELNFSEFANYSLAKQYRKLEEIKDEVTEGKMPLESYTLIHQEAKLSAEDKLLLASWTDALRDSMQKVYPPDSLIRKKK